MAKMHIPDELVARIEAALEAYPEVTRGLFVEAAVDTVLRAVEKDPKGWAPRFKAMEEKRAGRRARKKVG